MDPLIARYDYVRDSDLRLCPPHGVAYQHDMTVTAKYDQDYFDKCRGYEGEEIANKINAGRVALVNKYIGAGGSVLDVGIGSGEFIRQRGRLTLGYDVNSIAVKWLNELGLWGGGADECVVFDALTFWDVLEHMPQPSEFLSQMKTGGYVFVCLPIFTNLKRIRESKHYRPGEHLYYWTEPGFVEWMERYRYRLLEVQDFETAAGRCSIKSFAFVRDLPNHEDTLEQYRVMHSRSYGTSGMLYFEEIAAEVLQLNPKKILDWGCGRSDLSAHFWADGKRKIVKYDPAIPDYSVLPDGHFDLALVTDVMEHITMTQVDDVLRQVAGKASNAIFTISLRPAKAKLPDGRNAHVTLLSVNEWMRWVQDVFGAAVRIETRWPHILMVKTF